MNMLSASPSQKIQEPITSSEAPIRFRVEHCEEVDSTQLAARKLAESAADEEPNHPALATLITAARQTAGVGRNAKPWQSPPGGLWATLLYPIPQNAPPTPQTLGLAIGIACTHLVRRTLTTINAHAATIESTRLKWPNDVYVHNKKVLGVLTEIIQPRRRRFALVGVGLNLNLTPTTLEEITQAIAQSTTTPPTSILAETGVISNSHHVTTDLANSLVSLLDTAFSDTTWDDAALIAEANPRHWGLGQHQRIVLSSTQIAEGILLGLDQTGSPKLQTKSTSNNHHA